MQLLQSHYISELSRSLFVQIVRGQRERDPGEEFSLDIGAHTVSHIADFLMKAHLE